VSSLHSVNLDSNIVAASSFGMPNPTRMLEEMSGEAAFALIPQELKDMRIWLLWKLETRDGKSTKVPYQVNGRCASSTKSNTWTSFSEALRVFNANPTVYSGIGFAIVPPYTGVDFDKCRDPETGAVTKLATDAIAALHSYTEISQSGRGSHVIVKGSLPLGCKTEEIEVYPGRRYFTATGLHVNETPKVINECDMPSFRDTFMPKAGKGKREPNPAKDSFDRFSDAVAEKNDGNRWAPFERRVGEDFVLLTLAKIQAAPCMMAIPHF
jgi:hypothetical protein